MPFIPDNVRQEIIKLVPASVVNDISCFVFFDDHPRDPNKIDITVCTNSGEVKEFSQRDLVLSLHLDISQPADMKVMRNDNLDLFYLVLGRDELLIISRENDLKLHKRFKNVDRYELEDSLCSGQACLKVFLKDDAVPLNLDEKFNIIEDLCIKDEKEDSMPILTELMRKLTEAKYSVQCNEMMYEKLVKLRQLALFSKYQKINLNADDAVYKNSSKEIASALKIETLTPWVKICNKKVVIVFDIVNRDEESLEDVQVLLHGTSEISISYTTKLYENLDKSPFWREKKTHRLKQNDKTAVVVVIDLKELICNDSSKIEFDAVVMFKKLKKEFLLPLERVIISSTDTIKEDFDVLYNSEIDNPNIILSILATSGKTDLHMRHIRNDSEEAMTFQDIFYTHMHMESVPNTHNIVVHRKSPYHILHGVMVLLHDETSNSFSVTVYTRLPSQVLALIHLIMDVVPANILITTPNYKITAKTEEFCNYNEDISNLDSGHNYTEYAASILKRTTMLLDHLDNSIIRMNENKNPSVQSKIGKEIHLFPDGVASYVDFKNKMMEAANEGISQFLNNETFSEEDCEPMLID